MRTTALTLAILTAALPAPLSAGEPRFEKRVLDTTFFAEGASFADFDGDGQGDVVSGPYIHFGPSFERRLELYPPKPFDPAGYSDHFFDFPHDLDGDGDVDLFLVGFPGEAATWFENPGRTKEAWGKHAAVEHVDNESPAFTDLTGDGGPELVFHQGGRLGWAEPDPKDPRAPWLFHALSEDLQLQRFTHGLGVGDLDGDGRADVLLENGWWRQPESLAGDPLWKRHAFDFTPHYGGAQMLVFDVDGDGKNDVVTSLAAHDYGLWWWRQVRGDGRIDFESSVILPDVDTSLFGELHALAAADVDGDGLTDVVTGKRWWSHGDHGDRTPKGRAPLVWFELVRDGQGARFVPHPIDDASGVGVQVVAGDVDGDGRTDVVVGNKRGTFAFLQIAPGSTQEVPQPSSPDVGEKPREKRNGRELNLDFESGDLRDWRAEGEAFADQPIEGDTVSARGREASRHQGRFWVGGYEKLGDEPQGNLTSVEFEVTRPWASFLIGGGNARATRVELHGSREVHAFFETSAANYESFQRVVVDVSAYLDRTIYIRLVDEGSGGWGHVNFDDFRFHATKPTFERAPDVPAILVADRVEHAGLPADQAVKRMSVPAGFSVELVASEPDLHQPIALCFDARGRLWVAEAFTYPQREAEGEGRDDIVVFEDRDGDGRFETNTVFAQGLNLVSGLEVGHGGVFVGAAPYLLFLPDRNDDLVPDGPPEVLLDGWGFEDTHETLNAFIWGPDGWLYGCHGVFTHSRVGAPGTADDQRVPLDAAVWRYHPTRRDFEVFAWGTSNPWGLDWNDRGQPFITACVIPHAYHVIQGARYERQGGEHFDRHLYGELTTIADHRHYLGADPHGGNNRSDLAGGGHAHCGALIYLGERFPAHLRDTLFMSNIHGNRINNDLLERRGSGFVARHAPDLLRANDQWFRGINLKMGPDQSVYLIDWYDRQACHWTEVERWDRSNGRLYRVDYGEHRPVPVNLRALEDEELADLAGSKNEWMVRQSRVVLAERGGSKDAARVLRGMLERHPDPTRRLRALWALQAGGMLTRELAVSQLDQKDEAIVAYAVQFLCEDGEPPAWLIRRLAELAGQTRSALVRLHLASALQRLRLYDRWAIAGALLGHGEDADDANLPLMIWYGVEPLVPADPKRALALANRSELTQPARFIVRRAAAHREAHTALVRALAQEQDPEQRLAWLEEIERGLGELKDPKLPKGWSELRAELASSPDPRLTELTLSVAAAWGDAQAFDTLRARLADPATALDDRRAVLERLARARDPGLAPALQAALAEPTLRGRALELLRGYDNAATPAKVLALYAECSSTERSDAHNLLASRPAWARELLAAVEDGRVPSKDLSAFVLRTLKSHGDPELDRRIEATWGLVRATPADKQERIDELKSFLAAELPHADRARGREVFSRSCQQCHRLFEAGGDVGPELTGSNRRDLDYLLSNVVDPSAVVAQEYRAREVWLFDGQLVSGVQKRETEDTLVIATENDVVTVHKDEIEVSKLSELSAMPEGLFDALQPSEVRDLVAYTQGDAQSALFATEANHGGFFDGRSLAGWSGDREVWSVADGEIVGRTSGLEANSFLTSELELGDFEVACEVLLAGDQGNSGIQFRSEPHGFNEVHGYQADIGSDWWGKLYEEHGRAVLWNESGEAHVKRGEWNRYRIRAVGSRLQTWINDQPCVDFDDPQGARRGQIALQVHSGGPTEVRFRNLELRLVRGER